MGGEYFFTKKRSDLEASGSLVLACSKDQPAKKTRRRRASEVGGRGGSGERFGSSKLAVEKS